MFFLDHLYLRVHYEYIPEGRFRSIASYFGTMMLKCRYNEPRIVIRAGTLLLSLLMMPACIFTLRAKSGQALIDSAIQSLKGLKDDTGKAAACNFIAKNCLCINTAEGLRYATMAHAISERLKWNEGQATAYNIIGICYAQNSDDEKALQYWKKALPLFERDGNKKGIIKVVGNIGTAYTNRGAYPDALQNYYTALRYSEDLNDKNSIVINEGNIGATYEYLHDYPKAFEFEWKALRGYTELGDSLNIGNTLGNIGNLYADVKNYSKALKFMQDALNVFIKLGVSEGTATMTFTIGHTYALSGDYYQSLFHDYKVLQDSDYRDLKEIRSKTLHDIAGTLMNLAKDSSRKMIARPGTYALLDEHRISRRPSGLMQTAVQYLQSAIAINMETSSIDEMRCNYASLSEAQEYLGDYKASLASYKEFLRLEDSVSSVQTKIKIATLERTRDIELKDKQIIIDRLAVEKKGNERALFGIGFLLLIIFVVIIVRNIRLTTARQVSENKLQAFQARMNPHFIFNSLSSIQSLILNDEKEQSMDYLSEFSILMRQVLDNSALSKVPLKTEIEMLRSYIELEHLRFDGFSRNITIGAGLEDASVEVPGMIVQPFVENAILHGLVSKGRDGKLDITFERRDKHIVCTVEDNGVGRAASAEINAKRARKGQSHGTSIAIDRLAMLNDKKRGLVNNVTYIDKIEDGRPAGTKVIIELPIL